MMASQGELCPPTLRSKPLSRDWQHLRQRVEALSDTPAELIEQEDTFFACAEGRLKLRRFSENSGELITYRREDVVGTKSSHYLITRTPEPDKLRQVLAEALQTAGVVKKRRHLYFVGQTRIHLDEVDGLGIFLELEVVMKPNQPTVEGENIARDLMQKLGVAHSDLIAGAYVDLLASRTENESKI